jgi:hypothetical protein
MVIKRIRVLSVVKIAAILYAGIGLVAGAIFACIALVGAGITASTQHDPQMPAFFTAIFGVGAIIILPIMYSVIGAAVGALSAALYNFAAGMAGGIEFQVEP